MKKEGPAVPADASRSVGGAQGRAAAPPAAPPRAVSPAPAPGDRTPHPPLTRVVLPTVHLVVHVHGQLLEEAIAELQQHRGQCQAALEEKAGQPPALPWPSLTACSFFLAALASSERSRLGDYGDGGNKNWVLFLTCSHQNSPRLHPNKTPPPQALGASPSRAGRQAQGDEVAEGEQDPPPRVPPRCQAGPSGQGCRGGPCQQHGGPPEPRAERTIPLCHALWAHPALRRRQRREEQDKGGR